MKKEQILLVASLGVAGLVVWQSSGLYTSVGADTVRAGDDVDVSQTVPADPRAGLRENPPVGRNLLRQKRVEHPAPRPNLEMPPAIGLPWVRPLPWPELPPAFWGRVRDPMTKVAKPAEEKPDETARPADDQEEDPAVVAAREAADDKAREEAAATQRIADAAKIVGRDGRETPCRITPLGADQGQPVWVILEKWPNVRFHVEQLNKDGKSVMGSFDVTPDNIDRYATVHLERTLENQYHEERIRRGVKEGDRQANIDFAAWIRQNLAQRFGIPAVRLAMRHLSAAAAVQLDAALVDQIGDTCREAYDLDEEVKTCLGYLQGTRANDTGVIVRLGETYERAGALHAAREQYERAATIGDVEGRLRLAAVMLQLADTSADREAAYAEFERCTTTAAGSQKSRALAGMARVRLLLGNPEQAAQLATDARTADPGSFDANAVLGAAQYALGRFADAEAAFGSAEVVERGGSTRARAAKAMAMLAQGKLAEAVKEAQGCLDADALNYFAPLLVIGEAQQEWGELTASNDTFQTALQRMPRNPWILLRLAAIRLRDGLPRQALDLVIGTQEQVGLLQIAPESVDALRVAGLACGAQETPDWAGAVKYLKRALDKDPKSGDLIYDYARALHLGGRTDDAVAFLEKATDPNTGAAKNDARVLALLAFVYFDGGRPADLAFTTFNRARTGVQATWTKDWVDRAYDTVFKWNNTRIWEDDFERAPGSRVGNGWDEVESLGVQIQLDGHRVAMRGNAVPGQERSRWTGLSRSEDLGQFQSVDFMMKADAGFEFVAHLYQGELPSAGQPTGGGRGGRRSTASELGFGRDRTGKMTLFVYSGDSKLFGVPVRNADGTDRAWPDDGRFHKVTFRRTGAASKGGFEILFDDEIVPTGEAVEVGGLSAAYGKNAVLGVHLDADQGAKVDLQIESVQVERILGKR